MSNVLNRSTKQYLRSVNTPDYPASEWIHNPVLPAGVASKFLVIEGDTVREMTAAEKADLSYSTETTVYLVAEKQLRTNVNGHDYELDANAILNPAMPPGVALKYTRVVSGTVVGMTDDEKYQVDLPDLKADRRRNIFNDIRKVYSEADEISLLRKVILGQLLKTDEKITAWNKTVEDIILKYPAL